jgi:hypothetical protein
MTKYKEYFDKMVSENKDAFDNFTRAHFEYSIGNDKQSLASDAKNQEKFNEEGEKIIKIIHEYEDRLCKHSEGAGFGKYTSNLAEKFQDEIRSHFPLIDHIGIVVTKFSLKKIKL